MGDPQLFPSSPAKTGTERALCKRGLDQEGPRGLMGVETFRSVALRFTAGD